MDFANRKGGSKESVADKARRERNERAAAKKTADEAEIQQHAADVVTRGLRRFLDAQKAFDKLAKCLDRVLTDKPKSKLNLDTANANVNRIDHADHAEANVDTLNLSITRPRDLLLLLHLAQTVAAKLRTAQRKAENEVRLTNLCSALVAASSPSGTFVLSPFIANANYLATVSSKCISDLINTCLQRVIGENGLQKQSQSSYASGSETLLLLQALDGSKWVTNSSDSNALDSIKKSLVNDSRLWKSVHESILSKVKLIIALSKSHKSVAHTLSSADEKSVKKINLWINAMIHLSFLILATPFVGSSEKWICFSNYIMSVPLLIPTLDKSGLELWRKNSAFKNCLQVLSTDKFYKDDSFAFINGELSVFVIGNLVELFRSNSKPNGTSLSPLI
ncbi:hypothetical protein HK100_012435 [Physocladia obscura]|uniref:Uncharacterized protein n=1 Tax=Physocladia obscura TaxID=109957 RepID=A0AAD5T2C9_9FUNG|nr:hypothetical protein HK100_012435 [Physocladia obscura]